MPRLDPRGVAALKDRLTRLALNGADAGADVLRDKKLAGEGTGVHYVGQPRRASAPGEFPAEQTGALRNSIVAKPDGPLRAVFGPLNNPPGYVTALHWKPPAAGGRPFMDMALADEDVRDAIKKEVGAR